MHIPRPAKLLCPIDDGWGQLLAKYGNVVFEWTKLVIERIAGPVSCAVVGIITFLLTVLTLNSSAKAVKAQAESPVV